jgi:tetratricopeptide (TPR) repeat protein
MDEEDDFSAQIMQNPDLNVAKKFVRKFRKTYSNYNRSKYQFDLERSLMNLAICYSARGELEKKCKALIDLFELGKEENTIEAIRIALKACEIYRSAGKRRKASECLEKARNAFPIGYPTENEDLFNFIFEK